MYRGIGIDTPMMENQVDKNMEDLTGTGVIWESMKFRVSPK